MSAMTGDVRSLSQNLPKADDGRLEQMRQKIGTEFTSSLQKDVSKKKNELGKDDFMKLMSVQLKYQDPMSPVKNEQMAAQLAQFSSLEQMMNMNQNLDKMAKAQKPSEHMMAASLIGKRVTTDNTHFMLEKNVQPEISFSIPADASSVTVDVVSQKGEVVRKIELGQMAEGKQSIRWDGKNGKSQEQPLGEYSFNVLAMDKNDKMIEIKSDSTGIVSGVTFEAGKSMLIVDGKKVPIETIGVIESDKPSSVKPLAAESAQDKQNKSTAEGTAADGNKSMQVAKNNLPEELSPEKIKNMLSGMGIQGEVANVESAPSQQPAMPLWNPETN